MKIARVPAFAKINLALKVLERRADGYHELRTVFQTISVADRLGIRYRPARSTSIEIRSSVEIPNNLVVRAAEAVMAETGATGEIRFELEKCIPMGGGLGGGSTDAAAVLLALPAMAGRRIALPRLVEMAAALGSDVPFFLLGGTALGLGRGEELYPLPEPGTSWGVLVAPGVSVSTAEAYRDLGRDLTVTPNSFRINEFQSSGWVVGDRLRLADWSRFCQNDFEETVFKRHPRLEHLKHVLESLGANPALMTGSGSSLFGIFADRAAALGAQRALARRETGVGALVFQTLSRAGYRRRLANSLKELALGKTWPPQSRYAK